MRLGTLSTVLCSVLLLPLSKLAAFEMPNEIAAAIQAIGPVINPAETAKLYAPLHAKEPYEGVLVQRDQRYGEAERQRLDVFTKFEAKDARPILLFVHGGGYVRGDKRLGKDNPFYDNVMLWAVQHGMVGINVTYRLAPDAAWPSAAEDVALAVAWVRANAKRLGGDPSRIFIMAHSAGATHVAGYLARPDLTKNGDIAGAVLVSGTYRLQPAIDIPGQKAYFGADTASWETRPPLRGLAATRVPLFIVHGEIDVPYYIEQAHLLRDALCAEQRCPRFMSLAGHSHMSEVYAINTGDTTLVGPLLEFITQRR